MNKEKFIYKIVLSTATLTMSPITVQGDSSVDSSMYANNYFVASQQTDTGNDCIGCGKYFNSVNIRRSFDERMSERKISSIPDHVKQTLFKLSEECGRFDIKEVYADYSPVTNAIRIDMVIANGFLLIVRKTFDDDEDTGVAVSLSKGNDDYLADYIEIDDFVNEVDDCIKG